MDEKDFKSLWNKIALTEIKKVTDLCKNKNLVIKLREDAQNFKENAHSRYECERGNFRRKTGIKDNDLLDRHKVAAVFYVAFVEKNSNGKGKAEFPFLVYDNKNCRLNDLDATITHEIAFNIARDIVESFILSDIKMDSGYRGYISKNGLTEPELICFEENSKTSYKEEIMKQLIYAQQKENRISVAQLAIIFSLLESYTLQHYKLQ